MNSIVGGRHYVPLWDKGQASPDARCYMQVPPHQPARFPVSWASHTAPLEFTIFFVLILYFTKQVIAYIKGGRR